MSRVFITPVRVQINIPTLAAIFRVEKLLCDILLFSFGQNTCMQQSVASKK